MGDNVDVARALALVHVHTARALFFIILIILKAKLIFLIYLISTPRRASCKIYQNPRTKRAGFLGWVPDFRVDLRADLRADFREFVCIYYWQHFCLFDKCA